jgi:hypothetical protein
MNLSSRGFEDFPNLPEISKLYNRLAYEPHRGMLEVTLDI